MGAPAFQVFDASDGLPGVDFAGGRPGVATRDTQGRLGFAMAMGVTMVDPAKMRPNTLPPPVHIEKLVYYRASSRVNSPEQPRTSLTDVQFHLNEPLGGVVTLPPGWNHRKKCG